MGCGCGGTKVAAPPDVRVVESRIETVPNHPDNVFRPPNAPVPKTEG